VPNELRNAKLITVQLGLQWTCSRSFIMLNIWAYVAWYYHTMYTISSFWTVADVYSRTLLLFNSKALLSQQQLCDAAVNLICVQFYSGITQSSLR